jgi:6-phosphofructokinase 1
MLNLLVSLNPTGCLCETEEVAEMIKRIAVLTSGGDAPGMNAAIRAVTRCALDQGWEVFGVQHGYAGLIEGNFRPLNARSVGGILQQGGTFLGSARSPEFKTEGGRRKALDVLGQHGIDSLIVIGGNGSQTGAYALAQLDFPVVGVASTIDNDLTGSDITIGVDTALNIALEAIDRLKVTASSHQRAFLVEVMGRNSGYLALMAGIAGGAEVVVIPEIETTPEQVARELRAAYVRGKAHALAVVAEGAHYDAEALVAHFREHHERIGFELRVTTLGHVQRGGAPTAYDRLLATRLGAGAVATLARGETSALVGMLYNRVTTTPLAEIIGVQKPIDPELFALAKILEQ